MLDEFDTNILEVPEGLDSNIIYANLNILRPPETNFPVLEVRTERDMIVGAPTIIVMHGPSGVGKDTVLRGLCGIMDPNGNIVNGEEVPNAHVTCVQTTLNRAPRENDPYDTVIHDFVDFAREEGESDTTFAERASTKFEFAEFDVHYGNLYGLRRTALDHLLAKRVGVIRTDINGAETLAKLLETEGVNVIVVAVNAEREVVKKRLEGRGDNADSGAIARRLGRYDEEVTAALNGTQDVRRSDILLHNREGELAATQATFLEIVNFAKRVACVEP